MSTSTEITRLQTARNKIRDKAVELGISASTDKLDSLANAIDGIANKGAVSATVQEGDTYTIPKGYHNGSGTVSGVAGGGNYSLQSKTATPTKNQQNITPDSGYYGLSDVTVNPIPDAYQNVSSVNAGAADVLANKVIVTSDGTVTAGTMPNNGAVTKTLDTTTKSYTIPKGYHNGSGVVNLVTEGKVATPTENSQSVLPTAGKVLNAVVVEAIPKKYKDASSTTVAAGDILSGKTAIGYDSAEKEAVTVTGSMPNNGAVSVTLDTSTKSYTVPSGYHNGSGKVSITTEEKSVAPKNNEQTISPSAGKVLSKVIVSPIPEWFTECIDATITPEKILEGEIGYGYREDLMMWKKYTGTMPNNGETGGTIDGLTVTSMAIPAGYTTGGTVSLTNDIEEALAAI